jgi:hypothetical protein
MSRSVHILLASTLAASFGHACGGSATRSAPLEFTARHAELFDDGIDLIGDPDGLQGRWRSDWEADADARVAEADWIAAGTVTAIRVETDPEGRISYHVQLRIERKLKGEPPEGEVSMASREGAAGYASVRQQRAYMLQRGFVALVRYAAGEAGGRPVAHFHLSPPSAGLTRAVERDEAKRDPNRIKVIEHRQN